MCTFTCVFHMCVDLHTSTHMLRSVCCLLSAKESFPGILDALTYTEHLPLCIEASMHSCTTVQADVCACIKSDCCHCDMNMYTFPGILDTLTYIEHLPLCIEASIDSSTYDSTSKCIMHAHASNLFMVTSKWICMLS